jgi:hypothetical protein
VAVQWKKKASQRTQMGKASQAYKSLIGTKSLVLIPPEVICPTGEQITNGGFETGNFTGWTASGDVSVTNSPSFGVTPYAGSYCCVCQNTNKTGYVLQTFPTPIAVACFVASSVFQVHVIGDYSVSPPGGGKATIDINYTDSTKTTISWEATSATAGKWQTIDLKSYLEAGKTVQSIKITLTTGVSNYADLDSCTLQI